MVVILCSINLKLTNHSLVEQYLGTINLASILNKLYRVICNISYCNTSEVFHRINCIMPKIYRCGAISFPSLINF